MENQTDQKIERTIRKVVDRTPSMLAYWDRDLRCRFANRAYERWFGVDPQSLIGTSIRDLLGPQLFALNEPHIRAALRGEEQVFQRIVPGPDGVQRHSLAHYLPDVVNGQVEGFVVQVTDVTPLKEIEIALRSEAAERERALQLLRKSEAALQQSQRLGQIGGWSWEVEADIVTWSEQLYRIFGRDPQRLPPSYAEHGQLYTAESWTLLQAAVARALQSGESYCLELQYVRPDGGTGWIESRGLAERNERGGVVALHGTAQEVTSRRDARMWQAEGQRFRERIAVLTPGIVYVFDLERQCNVFISRPVSHALGYTPVEIEAMGAQVVSTLMHPDDRRRFVEHLARVSALPDDETAEFEHRMRDREGRWHWFISRDAVFSRDDRGGVREIIGTSIEITAKKAAEQGLRQSQEFTRSVLDNLYAFVGVLTTDGTLIEANRAPLEAAAIAPGDVLGKKFWNTYWFDHSPQLQAQLREWCERAAAGQTIRCDVAVRMAGDSRMWIDFQLAPLRDAQGLITHLIPSAMDISARRATEAALRASEEFSRTILESSPDCVKVLDGEGRLLFINANGLCLLEIDDAKPLLGQPWEKLWPPEGAAVVRDAVAKVIAGETVRFQAFAPTAKGTPKWWDVIVTRVPGADGDDRDIRLISVSRDITERKASEETVRQNADLFSRLIEQAPTGMYVVDAEFRLQQVNALASPVFGSIDPLIGRDFAEIMDTLWGPEVGSQCVEIFRHTLATGERYVSPPFSEQRFDLGVEQAFEWETQRVTLADGRHGVVCYFHEITARQRAERALRESEVHMRLATESTGVGIWEWHVATGRIKWDGQMFRIYGITPTADGFVQYEDWSGAVLTEDLARQEQALQDTVRRLGNGSREFRIRRRDNGHCRTIQSVETVRADARGRAEWVVGTNLDVTASRQMEQELKDAARRKDEFLATLAHELRNPLAPVRNSLEMIKRAGGNAGVVDRARATMERQVAQMVRLIDDLLDVSRITRDQLELKKERVDLATIVNHALEVCQPHCERAGQVLSVSLPPVPIELNADPMRLAQVLGNLLNNASKYTPAGGRIEVRAYLQDNSVVVTVRDTGIGIPAHMLPRIFDLFTQVDHSSERSKGGLGIGLALAKRLTEMHGGTVTAFSEGRDLGSEFSVRLPIDYGVREAALAEPGSGDVLASKGQRILIVDDNVDGAESLATLLTLNGHETTTAHDGLEAVAKATSFRPDVIVLDIGLPTLNGYEVARRIRQQPWGKAVLIVAQTGWGQESDREAAKDAGCDCHLIKPVDVSVLLGLLAARQSQRVL